MPKQVVDKVTITGAGKTTDLQALADLSTNYPFVEWGILLSKSNMGKHPRFPGRAWLHDLFNAVNIYSELHERDRPGMNISGHLCGKWVRDFCKGEWTWTDDLNEHPLYIASMFQRLQLNFHALVHKLDRDKFFAGFGNEPVGDPMLSPFVVGPQKTSRQFIFQLDDVNNSILDEAAADRSSYGHRIDAVPLFDLSGGAGILPSEWPTREGYCGYAGGLSPDNVADQLGLIEQAASGDIWIDVETHVRSEDDKHLDLSKVERFIKNALPWVKEEVRG